MKTTGLICKLNNDDGTDGGSHWGHQCTIDPSVFKWPQGWTLCGLPP